MERTTGAFGLEESIVNILPKAIYRLNAIPTKLLNAIPTKLLVTLFTELEQTFNLYGNTKDPK